MAAYILPDHTGWHEEIRLIFISYVRSSNLLREHISDFPVRGVPFRNISTVFEQMPVSGNISTNQLEFYKACPPETFMTCPVRNLACLLAKNRIVSAISSG